jgi:hypothetical protein
MIAIAAELPLSGASPQIVIAIANKRRISLMKPQSCTHRISAHAPPSTKDATGLPCPA